MTATPSHSTPSDNDSVGSSVYEGLVRLTFLCGRGLELDDVLERFLVAMRPQVPAHGLWLFEGQRVRVRSTSYDLPDPEPRHVPANLAASAGPDGLIRAHVLPGIVLTARPERQVGPRECDVIGLQARMLALAWQNETRPDPSVAQDDFVTARDAFTQRWLRALLSRHPTATAAARAAGLSRAHLYTLVEQHGLVMRKAKDDGKENEE